MAIGEGPLHREDDIGFGWHRLALGPVGRWRDELRQLGERISIGTAGRCSENNESAEESRQTCAEVSAADRHILRSGASPSTRGYARPAKTVCEPARSQRFGQRRYKTDHAIPPRNVSPISTRFPICTHAKAAAVISTCRSGARTSIVSR